MWHSLPKFNQTVSNFINKTYQILNNHEHESIVSWSPHGNSFLIKDIKNFQEFILPLYFKHSNFSSFVRQLNMYSFHKVRGDGQDCEFSHDKFKKGHPELLNNIKRKQSEGLIQSQNGIGEIIIHSQVLDKKEQIGRNSKPLSEQYLKDNPQKIPSRDLIYEHDALQKQNRQLKIAKQIKSLSLKTLNLSNGSMMGEKFFKLITSLYAEKIKKYVGVKMEEQNNVKVQKGGSFEEIIDHVMGADQPLSFKQYGKTAHTIQQKRTDYQFIMSKAIGNSEE